MSVLPKVELRRETRHPRPNHPWIYRSQIERAEATEPGALVRVLAGKRLVGIGYSNPSSMITVRLLTRQEEAVDAAFFTRRIEQAVRYRRRYVRDADAYRLASSEADGLPGLIVDRYGEALVVQFLTLGMERLRETILSALRAVVPVKGIYERSDAPSRKMEGLEPRTGWIERNCGEEIEVREGVVRYGVRFGGGHKTGLYLDQRENRLALPAYVMPGEEALDAFCYEGGFGLHLAAAGCRVTGVDAQPDAIAAAEANRERNQVSSEKLSFVTANVFDYLKSAEREKRQFDLVVLDPPSFVRKKEALEGAISGFKEIALRSMKILKPEGRLAIFSCSYHVDDGTLMNIAQSAALDTRKNLRVLRFLKQSADHPVDPFIPETYYLKGFLFAVS